MTTRTAETVMNREYSSMRRFFGTATAGPHHTPSKYKMTLATFLGVFPVVTLVNAVLRPVMQDWPLAVRSAATSAWFVVLLIWIVLPLVNRLLRGWLLAAAEEHKTVTRCVSARARAAQVSHEATKRKQSYAG